ILPLGEIPALSGPGVRIAAGPPSLRAAVLLGDQGRWGAVRARIVDGLRDLDELDRRRNSVQVSHLLTQLIREEIERRLLRVPDVEIGRQSGGLVECEELVAKARHAFKSRPSTLGDADHPSAVERTVVLEADVDTDHFSSSVRPTRDATDQEG